MTDTTTLTELTETSFDTVVLESDVPVLVDFWATWCPPCRPMAKVLEHVAAERRATIRVVKLNADDQPVVAARYRVLAMPTLILFHAGHPTWSVVGARSKSRIDTELDSALADLGVPSR